MILTRSLGGAQRIVSRSGSTGMAARSRPIRSLAGISLNGSCAAVGRWIGLNTPRANITKFTARPSSPARDFGRAATSSHAELSARNRRLRVHYLLEPGWKADAAIQGLGRTNRTNQAQPPLFRPIATDVKAEKRFLSTIARRLDTLGAITRGQRQTGGQGLFRPEDNLESQYGRDALRQLYTLLVRHKVDGCSLERFEDATGLKLTDANGLRDDLPPITTFLNRLLALTIDLQNILFTAFEQLLTARIDGAVASGTYDVGLETLRAESFVVTDRQTIYVHPGTGAETCLLTITQRQRNHPMSLDDALARRSDRQAVLLVNERSGRAAVQVPAGSVMRLVEGEYFLLQPHPNSFDSRYFGPVLRCDILGVARPIWTWSPDL